MSRWVTTLLLASVLLAACAQTEPRDYSPRDPCRDCPPGIFSGERGVIDVY